MARPEHPGDRPAEGPDDDFGREIDLLRSLEHEPVELVDAPPDLWGRIAAAAGVEAEPNDPPSSPTGPSAPASLAEPVSLDAHRRRQWRTTVLAAAAVVALVVGGGVFLANRSDGGPTEVAAAELLPYEGAQVGDASGTVELIDNDDELGLRVDMRDLPAPAPGTFYELWLLDPETGEPISVATMKDGSPDVATDISLPPGVDTERFDVVDVSVQEEDAGPEHSGNSVLRGTLTV